MSDSRLRLAWRTGVIVTVLLGSLTLPWRPGHAQSSASGALDLTTAIKKVAKQNIPTVVHIEVSERQEVATPALPFEADPFFRRFFNLPQRQEKLKREVMGLGTGMIMDTRGYILTNHHVAGGATKIAVLLANGQKYPARLVGTDPKTDLAVIRIDSKETLPTVTFGDSDALEVGDWVVAIGHPRGLDHTVTQGIISAKHRRGITDPNSYQDFLQTDTAINPGNSGGPLLNLRGEVIGVNAAIASQTGGFEGIGFAIPSNMATYVAKALIASGKVERAWLGVSIQDVTPELAQSFGLKTLKGALISDLSKDGPAEQAGLKKGDVVLTYHGKAVADAGDLRNVVGATPIGQEVQITVWRNGQQQHFTARVRNIEEATKALLSVVKDRLGVEVRPVTTQEAEKYSLDASQGLLITWVNPKGALGKAGFEVQDILLALEGQPIESVESLAELVNALKPKEQITVLALDHRTSQTGYVDVVVP